MHQIVWLYRGENEKFELLRHRYKHACDAWRDHKITNPDNGKAYLGVETHRKGLSASFAAMLGGLKGWAASIKDKSIAETKITRSEFDAWTDELSILETRIVDLAADKAAINEIYNQVREKAVSAEKTLRPHKDKSFNQANIKGLLRDLTDERDDTIFVLERVAYFESQIAWLDINFPKGVWCDVEGLCKIAGNDEIEEQNFSLNPGRHVGVAIEDDGMTEDEFRNTIKINFEALDSLQNQATELHSSILRNLNNLVDGTKAEGA